MVVARAVSKSAVWALGILLAASGCGYDDELPTPTRPISPPPVPPTQAAITLSVSPSPVDAVVALEGEPWSADWTITVRETSAVGGDIDFVRGMLRDAAGATIAETELDASAISEQLGGSNHIRGGSTQDLLMSLNFDFPVDAGSGDLSVTLQLTDERGNVVSTTADDTIRVCIPTLMNPVEGGVMDNGCSNRENGILWDFDWSDCSGAGAYHIIVQQRSAPRPLIDEQNLTVSSFTVLDERFITEDSRFGWFWKLRVELNGVWSEFTPETNFAIEPLNTDCVTP